MIRILSFVFILFTGVSAFADDTGTTHHRPALKADELFNLFGILPVTNSMLMTWIAMILLVGFSCWFMRDTGKVPGRGRLLIEWMVESMLAYISEIMGEPLARRTFWFLGSLFLVILGTNWLGLLPGVSTIGWGVSGPGGFHIVKPLLRGGNADLNMTLALALLFFVLWLIWAIHALGIRGVVVHVFGPKGESEGIVRLVMIVIFLFVGLLELLSILIRPISLSLRLFGNIFAGEALLDTMAGKAPHWALVWLTQFPFYCMEIFVGFVQASVFVLLSAVFIAIICRHDDTIHSTTH